MRLSKWLSDSNGDKTNVGEVEKIFVSVYHFFMFVMCLFVCVSELYDLYFDGHSDQQYKHVILKHFSDLSGFTTATFQMNPSELLKKPL